MRIQFNKLILNLREGGPMKIQTLIVLFVFTLLGGPAVANSLVDGNDIDRIVDIARGFGSAELNKSSNGDPKIVGRIRGTRYVIIFNGCVNSRNCDDIQFSTGWERRANPISQSRINQWNQEKRYGKAYLDSDRDPMLEMIVNLEYGVTRLNLEQSFKYWEIVVTNFKKEVLNEQ